MRTIFPLGSEGLGDAELILAARAGDTEAYAELTTRHADAARRLARLLVPTDDVEDLVSEAFAKVRLVLQRGDGPDLAFRPYLLTAVRRLHLDHGPSAPQAAPEPVGGPKDAAAAKAFTSLAEPWRMVLWHTEVEGEGPDEVAALLDESRDSMPALISRAREGMRIAWLTMHDTAVDADCEWTRHSLGAYVRKVSFDRDTARVERHLEGCARCSAIHLELTEGSADLRGILAPLVLGSAATAYLAATPSSTPRARAAKRTGARARTGAGAAIAAAGAIFGSAGSAVASATGRVGDQFARAKDFATTRTAATAVAGVAAVAVIAAGTFIVVQTADGPLEASAEVPAGVILDDESTAAGDTDGRPDSESAEPSSIGSAASAERSEDASADPSDDPSETGSASPSVDPSDDVSDGPSDNPSQEPTDDGPGRPSQQPSQQPTRPPSQEPSQQPTRPPTQQPTQPPTQQPTQPPTQAPTPPTDMSVSASTRDLAGLLWGIDVRVSGLSPGSTATLVVRTSSGSVSMDGRCSSGGTCQVTQTPTTFRFNAQALIGRTKTVTFTVYPDGDSDANTGDNSTSVTLR